MLDSALSDYTLVGTGQTIDFTGTSGNKDLPRGGIINEFDVGIGSGYQFQEKQYSVLLFLTLEPYNL